MNDKKCPNCGLSSPETAQRCDCGFDFNSESIKASYADTTTATDAKKRAELNLPTLAIRGLVFIAVCMTIVFAIYYILGVKLSGILLGIAFGVAMAVAMKIKINVNNWF